MFNIAVYVTSRYKNYPEFKEYMDGCIKKFLPAGKPSALVTGDWKSNDSGNGLVAKYAFENNIPFRRFATMWGKHNPKKRGKRNNAGVASNAEIVKNSHGCILFWTPTSVAKWHFMSGGCWSFLRMCNKKNFARPLIDIKVDIYKPIEKETDDTIEPSSTELPSSADTIQMGGVGGGISEPPMSSPSPSMAPPPMVAPRSAPPSLPPMPSAAPSAGPSVGGGMDAAPSMDGSPISQIPVDVDGDGSPDTAITAVDTDMNGTPDAIVNPIDSDGNGVIDKLELAPMPTAGQIVAANQNMQPSVAANSAAVPQNAPVQPNTIQTNANPSPQGAEAGEEKDNNAI